MMTKVGSTKIVNFMMPGTGVFDLGCGHIGHISSTPLLSSLTGLWLAKNLMTRKVCDLEKRGGC